jgi:hypothetical protein
MNSSASRASVSSTDTPVARSTSSTNIKPSAGYAQLGDGTTTSSSLPVIVHAPDGVTYTQVAGGLYYTVAVGSDGNTYAWGDNYNGQLRDGTTTDSSQPVQAVPVKSVKSITFGDVTGTIIEQGAGTVTVTTPIHAAGAVDVVLTWSDGVEQRLPAAYTFGAAPKVTLDPTSGKVSNGKTVELTAAATGDETPTVQWQISTDDGHNWSNVQGATTSSLSVKTAGRYRAVFRNGLGAATTGTAVLAAAVTTPPASTPTPVPTNPGSALPTTPAPGASTPALDVAHEGGPGSLAFTGSNVAPLVVGGILLLLLGGGIHTYRVLRSRRQAAYDSANLSA